MEGRVHLEWKSSTGGDGGWRGVRAKTDGWPEYRFAVRADAISRSRRWLERGGEVARSGVKGERLVCGRGCEVAYEWCWCSKLDRFISSPPAPRSARQSAQVRKQRRRARRKTGQLLQRQAAHVSFVERDLYTTNCQRPKAVGEEDDDDDDGAQRQHRR